MVGPPQRGQPPLWQGGDQGRPLRVNLRAGPLLHVLVEGLQKLLAGGDAELAVDIANVRAGRVGGDEQRVRDIGGVVAPGDEVEHFCLALAQVRGLGYLGDLRALQDGAVLGAALSLGDCELKVFKEFGIGHIEASNDFIEGIDAEVTVTLLDIG